jgi:hypothetical protein
MRDFLDVANRGLPSAYHEYCFFGSCVGQYSLNTSEYLHRNVRVSRKLLFLGLVSSSSDTWSVVC